MRVILALMVTIASYGCTKNNQPAIIHLVGEASPAFSALIDLKQDYEPATGVHVDIATVDRAKLLAAFSREAETPPDLVMIPHHLLGKLVAADAIHPIKSFIDDLKLFDPRVVDPQVDLLPWWREIGQYHRQTYGYPAALATTRPGLFFSWLAFLYASGARIIDSRSGDTYGPIVVNSLEAIRATEQFVSFQREGRPALAAIGRRTVPIDGDVFVIPSRASRPRDAFRVMQQILSNDVQSKMATHGVVSPRKSVSRAADYLDGGTPTPTIPEAETIIATITSALEKMISGAVTPEEGLNGVAVRLKAVVPGAENR